jgi:hypothetical protein
MDILVLRCESCRGIFYFGDSNKAHFNPSTHRTLLKMDHSMPLMTSIEIYDTWCTTYDMCDTMWHYCDSASCTIQWALK